MSTQPPPKKPAAKPAIEPETHEEREEEDVDVEEAKNPRSTGEDIEESRGKPDSDVESSRGGRNGDDVEPYDGESSVISNDSDVE